MSLQFTMEKEHVVELRKFLNPVSYADFVQVRSRESGSGVEFYFNDISVQGSYVAPVVFDNENETFYVRRDTLRSVLDTVESKLIMEFDDEFNLCMNVDGTKLNFGMMEANVDYFVTPEIDDLGVQVEADVFSRYVDNLAIAKSVKATVVQVMELGEYSKYGSSAHISVAHTPLLKGLNGVTVHHEFYKYLSAAAKWDDGKEFILTNNDLCVNFGHCNYWSKRHSSPFMDMSMIDEQSTSISFSIDKALTLQSLKKLAKKFLIPLEGVHQSVANFIFKDNGVKIQVKDISQRVSEEFVELSDVQKVGDTGNIVSLDFMAFAGVLDKSGDEDLPIKVEIRESVVVFNTAMVSDHLLRYV